MCVRPIIVPNKKLTSRSTGFDAYSDRTKITVPCGHCHECLFAKESDILTRMYFEYKDVTSKGGFAFMETLTYNNYNVPNFHGLKCFNKSHYQLFMKRLRVNLVRKLNVDLTKTPLRVVWASEYGGKFHRPHYHAIFFVHANISPIEFKKLINESWTYGFTDIKHPLLRVVTSPAGMFYVTKYIHKTDDFLDHLNTQKDSQEFLDYFNASYSSLFNEPFKKERISFNDITTLFRNNVAPNKHYRKHVASYMNILPFHTHSNGIGDCILNYVTLDDLLHDNIHDLGLNQGKPVRTPDYYIRHLLCDKHVVIEERYDRYNCKTYNEYRTFYEPKQECIELKMHRMSKNVRDLPNTIVNTLQLINSMSDSCKKEIVNYFESNGQYYATYNDISSDISRLLGPRTWTDFCLYTLFYKDRFLVFDQPSFVPDTMLSDYYGTLIHTGVVPLDSELPYARYNDCPEYRGFDRLFHVYMTLIAATKQITFAAENAYREKMRALVGDFQHLEFFNHIQNLT